MKLLVMNYSMNEASQVFSHQRQIVRELARHFDQIDVITAEQFNDQAIPGVRVTSTNWRPNKKISSLLSFYKVALPLLLRHRGGIVFSHMTEVQSSLIAPFCKFLKIRHFLWYAHKSSSFFLRFSNIFVNGILTSTSGSCPISGSKVTLLGQSIDVSIANEVSRDPEFPPKSWYHVGRIDPSKQIETIIRALEPFYHENNDIKLHFYGAPSSNTYHKYYEELREKYGAGDYSKWISFHGPIPRSELVSYSLKHDAFIHAFWGSLDKALVEAIMLKRIVVSTNPEYLREFCSETITEFSKKSDLNYQITAIYGSNPKYIQEEIQRKFQIANENHNLERWVLKLTSVLVGN